MNRILIALLALGMVNTAVPVFADEGPGTGCAICSKTTSDHWGTKAGSTLIRGVANTGGCWLEMANQPMKEMKSGTHNPVIGVLKGVGHTFIRLAQGVGEILTSPLPKAKDGSQIATDCPTCMWKG